jgi:hypothetical protein
MSFSIEITPREDEKGAMVHTVVVTIDDQRASGGLRADRARQAHPRRKRMRVSLCAPPCADERPWRRAGREPPRAA